jgi:ligand-binding SRPBCC domain-containing protein
MAVHSLKAVQKIPADLPTVWSFFSNPANLKKITPAYMRFNVISQYNSDTIYAGQIIEYTVRPFLGIALYWMTEITQVKDNQYFIDEQRYGPYSMWHHQHHFRIIENGIEMTDIVHYKMPLWFLGDAANALFVRKQLRNIFSFRYQKTIAFLGEFPNDKQELQFH